MPNDNNDSYSYVPAYTGNYVKLGQIKPEIEIVNKKQIEVQEEEARQAMKLLQAKNRQIERRKHYERIACNLIEQREEKICSAINNTRGVIDDGALHFINDTIKMAQIIKTTRISCEGSLIPNIIEIQNTQLSVLNDPLKNLKRFISKFEDYLVQLNQPIITLQPTAEDIIKDLDYIHKNIGTVHVIDHDDSFEMKDYIQFTTEDIFLTCPDTQITKDFGQFEITIRLADFRIVAEALDSKASTINDSTTHPHVQDDTICFGEDEIILTDCIKGLRILDIINFINSSLNSYNPDGAHVRINEWDGDEECTCCDRSIMSDDDSTSVCVKCEEYMCEECYTNYGSRCESCSKIFCEQCADDAIQRCYDCDEHYCNECFYTCSDCGEVICSECFCTCSDCGEVICSKCFCTCSNCGEVICSECSCTCSDCDDIVCNKCSYICIDCDERYIDINDSNRCKSCDEALMKEENNEQEEG